MKKRLVHSRKYGETLVAVERSWRAARARGASPSGRRRRGSAAPWACARRFVAGLDGLDVSHGRSFACAWRERRAARSAGRRRSRRGAAPPASAMAPERGDVDDDERAVDRVQEQRAERRARARCRCRRRSPRRRRRRPRSPGTRSRRRRSRRPSRTARARARRRPRRSPPLRTNARKTRDPTGMPARRAASGSEPIA